MGFGEIFGLTSRRGVVVQFQLPTLVSNEAAGIGTDSLRSALVGKSRMTLCSRILLDWDK